MNKLTLENAPFVDNIGTYTAIAWAIHSAVDENIINPRLGLQILELLEQQPYGKQRELLSLPWLFYYYSLAINLLKCWALGPIYTI